jgi:hypothetical protein
MSDITTPIIANTVLMVNPCDFSYNEETAVNNFFQNKLTLSQVDIQKLAQIEFNEMVSRLRGKGINVLVIESPETASPDAIFPNNWFSTHTISGMNYLFIYPMFSSNRKYEIQIDCLLNRLMEVHTDYQLIDLRNLHSDKSASLEGTGVLVFDHEYKYIFMARSDRTNKDLAEIVASRLGYKLISFDSSDTAGNAIYHTNVMLSIGSSLAFICLEAIVSDSDRLEVYNTLTASNKHIIKLTYKQITCMAANVLELQSNDGKEYLIISDTANNVLTLEQKKSIDQYCIRLPISIPTIEKVGGGGVRCMLAEVF